MSLYLYSFFHLNLAYSSIEQEDQTRVIECCYWPLLRLARDRNLPFGIELSGCTLEMIAAIDPIWVQELAYLVNDGPCELIGSGYAQVIGPLVSPEVTSANLRIGHKVYQDLLGVRPKLALLNEQAFSAGLVPLYREAGYKAIIMEWNNPSRDHPEWDTEWRYLPQRAKGSQGSEIDLIWNESIAFQKFQRYAHGELDLDELLDYVASHQTSHLRAFPVYGNDVEIFDYRPSRYMTEASIQKEGEWRRIDAFYAALLQIPDMRFIQPSELMQLQDQPGAGRCLELGSAAQPIPVKKQDKYNVVRWAVTGRDDLCINTRCRQIHAAMQKSSAVSEEDWKELCYLWSSDFRTHITPKRWTAYQQRLEECAKRWCGDGAGKAVRESVQKSAVLRAGRARFSIEVHRRGRFLEVRGERIEVRLNCLRGLALDAFTDKALTERPVCGTLHHGHFDDIGWGADYYSGHLVLESPGHAKITDLNAVEPKVFEIEDGLCIQASIHTPLGTIKKCWLIDDAKGRLRLTQSLNWAEPVLGSLRLGHITLLHDAFDTDILSYYSHNGGVDLESFRLAGRDVNHGRPVSFLVSANQAIGMTEGVVELGDNRHRLVLECDMNQAALIGLVTHNNVQGKLLTRLAFSARELDDTSKPAVIRDFCFDLLISLRYVTN
jgi:hypothetical protein